MDVGVLSGIVPSDRTGPEASSRLSREDFMKILLAEINHQDPMKPVDNQEFLSQLAQLQTIEATTLLTESLRDLVSLQRLSAAGQLIGMQVEGHTAEGEAVQGTVEKVVFQDNEILLSVGGALLGLDGVDQLRREEQAP